MIVYRVEDVTDPQVLGNQWIKFTVEGGVVWITVDSFSMPSNHECDELPADLTTLGEEALEQHVRILHKGTVIRNVTFFWD